ncbi:MAG: amidohydrolase family protein [Polyangiaceae bacterium]
MPQSFPTRFASFRELVTLPWFDWVEGELTLDPNVGSSIDVHTHLALAYVLRQRLDLRREHAKTEHYLPLDGALDLDVYANVNFASFDLARMKRDLSLGAVTKGGMRRTHTTGNLLREMRALGITTSVLLAIDFPVLSDNAGDWLRAARGEDALVVFGSVHPYRRDIEGELDRQLAMGARGIKVHPAVQTVHPSARRCLRLYQACGKRGLPVFWHCGPVGIEPPLGRYLTRVQRYARAIEQCPDTTFVLGHTGALEVEEALELHREFPNVWVEVASQGLPAVRRILERAAPDRIMMGSDWPFYHQAMPLAKLLIATEGAPDVRRGVLRDNASRLLGLDGATS